MSRFDSLFKRFDKVFNEMDDIFKDFGKEMKEETRKVEEGEEHETVVEETRPDGTKIVTRSIIRKGKRS